jgi:hypothetical protein
LAEEVVRRLMLEHGPALIIVHGAATGIDQFGRRSVHKARR